MKTACRIATQVRHEVSPQCLNRAMEVLMVGYVEVPLITYGVSDVASVSVPESGVSEGRWLEEAIGKLSTLLRHKLATNCGWNDYQEIFCPSQLS